MVIATVCVFTACGEGDHTEHNFGEWSVSAPASCEKEGERTRKCAICGFVETQTIDALGHDIQTTVTKAATCEGKGEELLTCSRCDYSETKVIPAAGHDWGLVKEIEKATCLKEGRGTYFCYTCSNEKEDVIPKADHVWDIERTVEPDCENPGTDTKTCRNCQTTVQETVGELGHVWTNVSVSVEATCEGKGVRLQECSRCKKTRNEDIEPLGHRYESAFTVDEPADFDHSGSKSRHCLYCEKKTDETVIPTLKPDVAIDYDFKLMLNNGRNVSLNDAVITVYDEAGAQVAQSTRSQIKNGVYTASLLPKNYTVKVTGLPKGYVAEDVYNVSYKDTVCSLWIGAKPINETVPASYKYKEGDVMYDFKIKPIGGNEITLSGLLETKKIVVLNFFYVGCQWCAYEFPGMQTAYEKYKNDVAIIAIDPYEAHGDTENNISSYAAGYGLSFYLALDKDMGLHNNFGVAGYPATVIIDKEGVVAYIHRSSLVEMDSEGNYDSTRLFNDLFARYTSDSYWKNPAKQSNRSAEGLSLPQAILPSDKRGK